MKKYIILTIIIVIFAIGLIFYKSYYNQFPPCLDGFGMGTYILKDQFFNKISMVNSKESFDLMLNNFRNDQIAFESYRCGDTNYVIKDGEKFKEVNKSVFQSFIDEKTNDLVKIHQSGNSPYFINDLGTKKNYSMGDKDGKYTLIEDNY